MVERIDTFSSSNQGVAVSARHFFGVNTNVHDCLFLVQEDNSLLYVAGHNIILYKLDEKEQYFMPGKLRLPLENVEHNWNRYLL